MKRFCIISFCLFLNTRANAIRAIMEQVPASNATIFIDTINIRVGLSTAIPQFSLDIESPGEVVISSANLEVGTTSQISISTLDVYGSASFGQIAKSTFNVDGSLSVGGINANGASIVTTNKILVNSGGICFGSISSCQSSPGGGGGGSSTLQIATGTLNYSAQVTSPTISIQFDSRTFVGSAVQTSTAAIQLNSSSVTLVGQLIAGSNITLTPGVNNLTIASSAGGGGGATSVLAITTGGTHGFIGNVTSSPTFVINFDSNVFTGTLPNGSTAFISITTNVVLASSITVTYLYNSSASITYVYNSSAAVTYFNKGNNLPTSNLNSGTGANASTFWRGDGTWVKPSPGDSFFISTGHPLGWLGNVTSTPTAGINFDSGTFISSLNGGTTAFIGLSASSVTLVGQLIAGSNITLTPGTNNLTIAATAGGGGGGSSLAVTTGNPQGNFTGTATSSPTAVIVFDSMTVIGGVVNGTFTFKINSSSVTEVGQIIAGNNITITPGTNNLTIAASSGSLLIGTGSTSGWTGSLFNFVVGGTSGGSSSGGTAITTFSYVINAEAIQASSNTYIQRATSTLTGGMFFPNGISSTGTFSTILNSYQGGALDLYFIYTATATSGAENWAASLACIPSTATLSFDTVASNVATSSVTTENSNAQAPTPVLMTSLDTTNCAPNATVVVYLNRSSQVAADTSLAYGQVRKVWLREH